jgi:hypothetical protein
VPLLFSFGTYKLAVVVHSNVDGEATRLRLGAEFYSGAHYSDKESQVDRCCQKPCEAADHGGRVWNGLVCAARSSEPIHLGEAESGSGCRQAGGEDDLPSHRIERTGKTGCDEGRDKWAQCDAPQSRESFRIGGAAKWLDCVGDELERKEIRSDADRDEQGSLEQCGRKSGDDSGPVAKHGDARVKRIGGGKQQVEGDAKHEKVTQMLGPRPENSERQEE